MWDDYIPFSSGETGVTRTQACNEMILEGTDVSLSSVASVRMLGDKLERYVFILEHFVEVIGTLVVEDVKVGVISVLL